MEERQIKLCKSCYQEIDLRAKKCPYCQSRLTNFSIITNHPLFGILLMLLIMLGWYIFYLELGKKFEENIFDSRKEFSLDSGLIIKSHHGWKPADDQFSVIGVVANKGKDAWDSLDLEVELFDKDGNFVYECSEYLHGTLYAGNEENFVVHCSRCEKSPIPSFDTYKIKIVNAFYRTNHN